MSSNITESYKQLLVDLFTADVASDSATYFVGLSNAETITETEDVASPYQESKFRHTLLSVKRLSNASFVVARENWTANVIYTQYDNDLDTGFYVVNSDNEVFICVETSRTVDGTELPSTVEPTSTLASNRAKTFETTDGYKWRYLYPISNIAVATYNTIDWIPVKKVIDTGAFISIPQENRQLLLQDSAVAGEILNLQIDSAGTGYTTSPTITITGNGSNARFVCDVNGGRIVRVRVDSDGTFSTPTKWAHGSGYDFASAIVSTGDAVLRPVLSRDGLNADPIRTLRATSVMLQTDFAGDEFDTILAQNDFSQIGILRNLKKFSDSDFTGNTGNALKTLELTTITTGSQLFEDEKFRNNGQTAVGKVVHHDTVNQLVYYYQDEETHFTPFDETIDDTISAFGPSNSGTSGTFTAVNQADFNTYSGDVLYINNINALGSGSSTIGVSREDTQTEDIRIVIQLG
jgi:hypothetical protein